MVTLVSDVVAQLAILDQPVRDVDAEAGDAALEPEAEDPLELGPHLRVPPVEIRLLLREVVQVVPPARLVELPGRPSAEDRLPVVRNLVGPDVEVGPLPEPWVLVGRVVRDEVEEYADVASPRLGNQSVQSSSVPRSGWTPV